MADTPQQIGPYRIVAELGRGGLGSVYRALHVETSREAAVKVVRHLRAADLAAIRAEIHALSRLEHPCLVRVHDDGVAGGMPWFAMDLVSGAPLDAYCARLRGGSGGGGVEGGAAVSEGALCRLLELFRVLCDVLAYVHGEGLVHRDLKPANILVSPEGLPTLLDFGLATRFFSAPGGVQGRSREVLQVAGHTSGTLAYMSPEQIRGDYADARSDLYSLGCLLFQALTGAVPFSRARAPEVILAHLHASRPAPSTLMPGLPPRLDELVVALMQPRPHARPGYASDVAARLEELGAAAPKLPAAPPARPFLYRPRLAGRTEPFTRLQALLAGSRPAIAMVGGESGVGKTRLAMEVATALRRRGHAVIATTSARLATDTDSPEATGPLHTLLPILDAVADHCYEHGPGEARRVLGGAAGVLAPFAPRLRRVPGLQTPEDAPPLPPSEARVRLYEAFLDVVTRYTADQPLLIVLDDLQWADELSLSLLAHWAGDGWRDESPLRVLGTYRSEEVGERLPRLLDMPSLTSLSLTRLALDGVEDMVRDMLAMESCPRRFACFLWTQSEGNPFFVAEYLLAAVQQGLLWRNRSGVWQVPPAGEGQATEADYRSLELPTSLRALVGRRLSALSAAPRAVVEAAAVLGREVSTVLLGAVAGLSETQLIHETRPLVFGQIVELTRAGGMRFVHDKIREVAAAETAPERRRELHRRAAEAIAAQGDRESGDVQAALGLHWEAAGFGVRAAAAYLLAARRFLEQYAYSDAETSYRAWLRLGAGTAAEMAAIRCELATRVLSLLSRPEEALAELRQALRETREAGATELEPICLMGIGDALWRTGKLEDASAACAEALALSRQCGDRGVEGRALNRLGTIRHNRGLMSEAEALYGEALDIYCARGDRRAEGGTLHNLAILYHQTGRAAAALELFERDLAICRELGNRAGEGSSLSTLATFHHEQGDPERACAMFAEALAANREVGDGNGAGTTLAYLAQLQRQMLDLTAAAASAGMALPLLRRSGDRLHIAFTLCQLGHAELARGQSAAALLAEAQEIAAALEARKEGELGRAVARLARAQAAAAAGQRERLLAGELREDFSAGMRSWLAAAGKQ
ncbi:MAG: protein kinase [Candidatus Schekmanbacteria bacterium]|nr:protein kinase [Candidatus Schekmanbacteria bacterium]